MEDLVGCDGAILIIDDDVDYCCLMQVALMEAQVQNPVQMVYDGLAAIDYLESRLRSSHGVPLLVLLDLKMPRIGGLQVLQWIRGQPALGNLPVVIFTGVEWGKELFEAISAGATSLLVKPCSYGDLVRQIKDLRDEFLTVPTFKRAA